MAAALTSYTNTAAVRACLGVDEQDCPDSILLDSNLSLELLVDLDEWLSGHAATLGWMREDTLLAPDNGACRVVMWVRSEAEVAALRDQLKTGRLDGSLCVISPAGVHSKELEP